MLLGWQDSLLQVVLLLLFGAAHSASKLTVRARALLAFRSLCCACLGTAVLLDLERVETARGTGLLRQGRRAAAQALVFTRGIGGPLLHLALRPSRGQPRGRQSGGRCHRGALLLRILLSLERA